MTLKQIPRKPPPQKRRVPTRVLVGLAIIILVGVFALGYISEPWSYWTGVGGGRVVKETTKYPDAGLQKEQAVEYTEEKQSPRTLWDWISLVGVGAAVALVGYVFSRRQKERDEAVADLRAQGEALQAYLDRMSDLTINKKLGEKPKDSIRRVAQARTIETLLVLDKDHKRRPLKLLYELSLIERSNKPIALANASLDHADLSELALSNSCLRGVDLRATDLSGANLSGSDLSEADLRGADLTNADLSGTDLSDANLLPYDEGHPAKLSMHNLKEITAGSIHDELRFTTRIKRKQRPTRLSNTNLEKATLSGTILGNTDLRGATGLEQDQLKQAIGNPATKLPKHLKPPNAWKNEAIKKQIKTRALEKQIEMRIEQQIKTRVLEKQIEMRNKQQEKAKARL